MVSEADEQRMRRILMHAAQVQDGVIPADSPDEFTVRQPETKNGLPWFFGDDYKATPEAIAEFTTPMDAEPSPD